jgi:hypothetical protein
MKNTHTKVQARAAQQDLFVEAPAPPAIAAAAFEEIRSALAELLLDAMRANGKERASESQDH